jgi:DNA mismatch repair ATPase MutS
MNATLTTPGEVCLYALLRSPSIDIRVISHRARAIQSFRESTAENDKVLQALHLLGNDDDTDVASLLWGQMPTHDPKFFRHVIYSLTTVLLLILLIVGVNYALIPLALSLLINIYIYSHNHFIYSTQIPRLTYLLSMIRFTEKLVRHSKSSLSIAEPPKKSFIKGLRSLAFLTGLFTYKATGELDLLAMFLSYFKVLLLADAFLYRILVNKLSRHVEPLRSVFLYIGELDALQAAAVYRNEHTLMCPADLTQTRQSIDASEIYHPLLERPVANSCILTEPGAIITGANMSGKSTFLRTIGLNVLLAQTIGNCHATAFSSGLFHLRSLIQKHDDILTGKSFYCHEAERILEMVRSNEHGPSAMDLYIIDEFFSGTNSLERVKATIAVMSFLKEKRALTLAATHDLLIAEKLSQHFACFYFEDTIANGTMQFDYLLRFGIVRSTNGIRLLEELGFPDRIIKAARQEPGIG